MQTNIPRPKRRLHAARLIGAAALGVLGMVAAEAPVGHFGASNEVTFFGAMYAAAVVTLAVSLAIGVLLGRRWGGFGLPLVASVNVVVFVPALGYDMRVAGAMVFWNLVLLAGYVFAGEARGSRLRRPMGEEKTVGAWYQRHGEAARHLLMVALFSTVVVGGFELTRSWLADLTCFVLDLASIVLTAPLVYETMRGRRAAAGLLAVVMALGLWGVDSSSELLLMAAVYQVLVLFILLARGPIFADLMRSFVARPALLILSTFAVMAGTGALLLSFPAASRGAPLAFIDALFTATSAGCITGLTVVDTATTFTDFGLAVIVVLLQLGGLGIMVLSTFATVLLGGRLALRSEQALEEVLDLASPGSAYKLTRFIVLSTLAIEAVGACLLAWAFHGRGLDVGEALWAGVFHAVAAFCHAGFSLWPDSLVSFQSDGLVLGVHMVLMLVGSLGFSVMAALWLRMVGAQRRFSLQTRVVLWMTLGLLVLGTLGYTALEWEASLRGMSTGWKWVHALFMSITLRSGGFTSVDLGPVEPATVVMMMMLMFIGAAPGSTGGGIKVTTFAVMLAAIPALIRAQPRATLMRRTIPLEIIYRAATIVTVAALVVGLALILLLATHKLRLDWMAFEVISALSTVGLSLGATGELGALGKWVVIGLMFIGRVGPTSLALAVGASRSSQVRFPEGRLMVG